MRAIVQREFGAPDVLRLEECPAPTIRAGWTVVELRCAALNWHDVLVRRGRCGSPLPHTPGADGAGIDLRTGAEVVIVPSMWWGERQAAPDPSWEILGDSRAGTYAEQVLVPVECVAPKPAGLAWPEAAALPLVGLTVYRALFTRGRVSPGEQVLVLGAGGGVASAAVAFATAAGAEVVVTSSSDDKIARAVAAGARGGVRYDGVATQTWPEAAKVLAGGDGFDLVLDSVGDWSGAVRALRPGGRIVTLGANRDDVATLDVRSFYFGQYDLLGTTLGSPNDFSAFLAFMARTSVAPPVIDRVFPLDLAADAHAHLESGRGFGKVVLEV